MCCIYGTYIYIYIYMVYMDRCQFCHIPHDMDEVRRVRPSKATRKTVVSVWTALASFSGALHGRGSKKGSIAIQPKNGSIAKAV